MSAPLGNNNAARAKEWRDQLKWALENYSDKNVKRGQALRVIATNVVKKAIEGDAKSWEEIANRLDGKPIQAIEGTGDGGSFNITITRNDKSVL